MGRATKTVVKKEKTIAPVCVASLTTKQANSKFEYNMRHCPTVIRRFYDGKFKMAKLSDPEKRKFVEETIKNPTFEGDYFKQLQVLNTGTVDKDSAQWLSYESIVRIHGKNLVAAMVKQKTIETQPHEKLDFDDKETLETIDPEERLQYREVTKTHDIIVSDMERLERSTEAEPTEHEGGEDDDMKRVHALCKKTHNAYVTASIDIKIRMGKLENNKYRFGSVGYAYDK